MRTAVSDRVRVRNVITILTRKIKDSRFINLIRKFLKAGYMEDWKYHATYSGTPQGGILSPILANIYLNEIDMKIEKMKKEFDKHTRYTCTHEYGVKSWQIEKIRHKINETTNTDEKAVLISELKQLRKELRRIPAKDSSDKKIVYVRYADDFLIGVKCELCGAENIAFEIHHINKLKNLKGKEL